jgi:hypothetical protein
VTDDHRGKKMRYEKENEIDQEGDESEEKEEPPSPDGRGGRGGRGGGGLTPFQMRNLSVCCHFATEAERDLILTDEIPYLL